MRTAVITTVQAFSTLLLVLGGVVFLFGDRALTEFWKLEFASAELIGIGGGLLVMFLGGLLQYLLVSGHKSDKRPETSD